MSFLFVLCPIVTWFFTGIFKFSVNYIRHGKDAVRIVGLGGFPSNHTAIVTSTTTVIALSEGLESPSVGLGVALLMIVVFDATSLRKQVGLQARVLNSVGNSEKPLRERIGHTKIEILGGLVWGALFGWAYFSVFQRLLGA